MIDITKPETLEELPKEDVYAVVFLAAVIQYIWMDMGQLLELEKMRIELYGE